MSRRRTYGNKKTVDSNTLLLLTGDDFADHSLNNYAITNNGVTLSSATAKFVSSYKLNGNAYLSAPKFTLGTSDFTIDFWVNLSSTNGIFIRIGGIPNQTYSQICLSNNSGVFRCEIYPKNNTASGGIKQTYSAISTNTWHHIALVRNSTSFKLYLDGTCIISMTSSMSLETPDTLTFVGGDPTSYNNMNGYIDELRISNIARWISNFTPPTKAY